MARLALVTGATGFMARHLVPALTERGWEIRATGRRPRPGWLPAGVGYEPADLAADDDLQPLCRGVDCIFHLAGATSSLSSTEEMHQSNAVATTNLVAAARREGVGRLVHMGSTSIYGEEIPLPQPLVETVEPHPSRGYGKAKWLAEQAVWAPQRGPGGNHDQAEAERMGGGHAEGLPAVVLRPVSVFGPGAIKLLASAVLDVAIERFAGRPTLQVDATPVELRLVHVADVVGAACHLADADAGAVSGHAYNVVASSYPTSLEVAGMLARALGISLEESPDPACGMGLDERRAAWQAMVDAGMEPSILFTEERFRFLRKANRNNRLSVDALLATGFRFSYGGGADLADGVEETIDWYRDRRWIV